MLIKIKKTYDRIFKTAKNAVDNRNINLVDALIDRTREEGVVNTEGEDLDFREQMTLEHKGFFVQVFEIGDMYKAYAATDTLKHNIRFESDLHATQRKAVQDVMKYIDQFRSAKPNDNRVGRN